MGEKDVYREINILKLINKGKYTITIFVVVVVHERRGTEVTVYHNYHDFVFK